MADEKHNRWMLTLAAVGLAATIVGTVGTLGGWWFPRTASQGQTAAPKTSPAATPSTPASFVAPLVSPSPAITFGPNLALGRQVRASKTGPGRTTEAVVDGDRNTWWNAGEDAPQWIEIDLGRPQPVAALRLMVSQHPAGPALHRVSGRASSEELFSLLHVFRGWYSDREWLTVFPQSPWAGIRHIKVETTESVSWVGWLEIEILAPS